MYIKEIELQVLELFSRYPGAQLKMKELSSILSIKKHDYKNLNDTVRKLIKDNLLIKEGQYFTGVKEASKPKAKSSVKKKADNKTTNLIDATFDATSLGKGYSFGFATTPDNDYFISSEDLLNAYHGDKIQIEPYKQKSGKYYGIVRNVVERVNHKMIGNATKYGKSYIFVCDNHKIHTSIIVDSPN